jgi:MiaB/RimO family radical SAM methylthiotransferase
MCTTLKLEVKRIHDYFLANDWTVTKDPEEADIVLCLTCSGWKKLEDTSFDRLQSLKHLGDRVVVVGCVGDNSPEEIAKVHNGTCIPTKMLDQISSLIPDPKIKLSDIPEPSTFKSKEDYRLYDLTKRFVNIAFGCSFSCSYCPHKIGLGKLRSRSVDDILNQINDLVSEDVRIVVLTGMETAMYGRDIGTTYPDLLRKVLEMNADFEIHVAQFNPLGIIKYHDELLPLFSNHKVTDIQIPIQTTNDRILKLMHRPHGTDRIGGFLTKVKEANQQVILRTDLMVGFPTETMEELEQSLEFASEIFDEVAVYGVEIRESLPVWKLKKSAFSEQEINRRIKFATDYIESKGTMAHGGQQSDIPLTEVEKRKESLRKAKKSMTC